MQELSTTTGDYLKTIFILSDNGELVSTSRIAEKLNISNASVSDMLKKLNDKKYVIHEPYKGVALTPKGKKEALKLIRRHRLWELFLVEQMKLNWEEVHERAERLEHVTDELLEDRLSELLGNPNKDPHGHPIPDKNGDIREVPQVLLSTLSPGQSCRLVQCTNEDTEFLRYLEKLNLLPGQRFTLKTIQPFDGPYSVELDGKEVYISPTVANYLLVELEE